MTNDRNRRRDYLVSWPVRFLLTTLIAGLAHLNAFAQSTTTGPLDKQTPLALTPGMPAGAEIENYASVNLFNGHLGFGLPLASVGGRGELNVPITLSIERPWGVQTRCDVTITGQTFCRRFATSGWWGTSVGYGPGVVEWRRNQAIVFTFRDSTGTEHELRDVLTKGQPNPLEQPFTRGTNFSSVDGSSITFVSDTVITDTNIQSTVANGYLLFPNGARWRVELGLVRWIRDRNGNKITYTYESNRVKTIKDPLDRTITINYDVNDPTYGLCDQIILPGFNGASRTITIAKTTLGAVLRADQPTPRTFLQLFPEIPNNINQNNVFNPPGTVSAVYLPNGQAYRFTYNVYGELAGIQVPQGGGVEYDYLGGLTNDTNTGAILGGAHIYRRVVTKRLLTNATDPSSVTRTTTYSRPETWNNTAIRFESVGFVTKEERAADNSFVGFTKHYLFGVSAKSFLTSISPFPGWREGREHMTETMDSDLTTVLRRSTMNWQQRCSVAWWPALSTHPTLNPADEPACDPRVVEKTEAIEPNGANLVFKTSSISPQGVVGFDQHNNQTDSWDYPYGVGGPASQPIRHVHTDYLGLNSANNINYSNPAVGTAYTASDPHIRNVVRAQQIYSVDPASGTETLVAQSETRFDEGGYPILTYSNVKSWIDPGAARANATTLRHWLGTAGWIEAHNQYDQVGNVRKIWDVRDTSQTNPTQLSFTDSFSDSQLRDTYAFLTTVTTPIPDASGQNGSASAFVSTSVYDFNTGKVVSTTDPNGKTTSYDYTDPLDRLKMVTQPDTSRVRYNYFDSPGDLYVQTLTDLDTSRSIETRKYFDGLGRLSRDFAYDGTAGTPWIVLENYYDAAGRLAKVSNRYRVSSATGTVPTTCPVCTTMVYDTLGRVRSVTTPDSAQIQTSYGVSNSGTIGIFSIVTNESGRQLRNFSDAFGRLIRVDEPNKDTGNLDVGGTSTSYVYDARNKLRKVTQGTQQRFFFYDAIGRLIGVKHPEQLSGTSASSLVGTDPFTGNSQWSLAYEYDNNGNLTKRIDARNVVTTYEYDAINRLKSKDYSDTTPDVTVTYDTATLGVTRMASVSSTATNLTVSQYDELGRVKNAAQTTDGVGYPTAYTYNLAGAISSKSYPSGKIITTEYDIAGRPVGVKNQNQFFYIGAAESDVANRIRYAATGGVEAVKLGNGLWEHTNYNSRLQPTQIGLGTSATDSSKLKLDFDYGLLVNGVLDTTKNDGNIQSQTITAPNISAIVQRYEYDAVNRLKKAQELGASGWTQEFSYDQFGNRTGITVTDNPNFKLPTVAPEVNAANNQFKAVNSQSQTTGYDYDATGNLIQEPEVGTNLKKYVYDGENHVSQTKLKVGAVENEVSTYSYDPAGQRIKTVVNGNTTVFVYDIEGQLIAEYSTVTPPSSQVTFMTSDTLGSTRITTGMDQQPRERHDYLPFGEEIPNAYSNRGSVTGYGLDSLRKNFTTYDRDSETQLDFAQARYYHNRAGRFTSVDPFGGSGIAEIPQSWNRYSYCINNPVNYVDPTGLLWVRDTRNNIFIWVPPSEYKEGNQYYDDQDRYETITEDQLGPNGITFTLGELRGADDTPENRAMLGQEVYLGTDGKIHLLYPPLNVDMPQSEQDRIGAHNRQEIADILGATFNPNGWKFEPNPNIPHEEVVKRAQNAGFTYYLDFHPDHWGGDDYEGQINGTWYHLTIGDPNPEVQARPPKYITAFSQALYLRPSGMHRVHWVCQVIGQCK